MDGNCIPKTIHYCWFGGNPLPNEAKKCIDSWKKYCPDYEIIEWNESNFDLNINMYIKEAYEKKKWAFITDYVRLYVLYTYGGIYMDTDVELLKSLDPFLKNQAFSGFESSKLIPTGIMASIKGFALYKEFLNYYKDKHFVLSNGACDMTTNVEIITNMCKKYGFNFKEEYQNINGWILYPHDYFCPKDYRDGKIYLTENTVCIHHFSGSWKSENKKKVNELHVKLCKKYGRKMGLLLYNSIFIPYRVFVEIKDNSIKGLINKMKKKVRI